MRTRPIKLCARATALVVALGVVAAACGSSESDFPAKSAATETEPTTSVASDASTEENGDAKTTENADGSSMFQIDVWADNWMAAYVDGVLIGEDSVPITTERSFNSESFTFEATAPFTIAIEAKDFKETDSGIEYIGLNNQQMGDGGIIAQITDLTTGEVVGVTNAEWSTLVVHQAPLNTECERDPDPDQTCDFLIVDTPTEWTSPGFDDSSWANATVWSPAEVSPKDGYNEINWDGSAELIWGTDLEVDNTILLRTTIS